MCVDTCFDWLEYKAGRHGPTLADRLDDALLGMHELGNDGQTQKHIQRPSIEDPECIQVNAQSEAMDCDLNASGLEETTQTHGHSSCRPSGRVWP